MYVTNLIITIISNNNNNDDLQCCEGSCIGFCLGVEINDADAEKVLTIPDAVKLVARLMGVPEAAH